MFVILPNVAIDVQSLPEKNNPGIDVCLQIDPAIDVCLQIALPLVHHV